MPGLPSAASARTRLLDLLRREGIQDESVLRVMGEVPREWFVPAGLVALHAGDPGA